MIETGKKFIIKMRYLKKRIGLLQDQIEKLDNQASGVTAIRYDLDKVQTSPENRIPAILAEILMKQNRLVDIIKKYQEMEEILISLDDEQERALRMHYLEGKDWKVIAIAMGYSEKHIYKIQREALDELGQHVLNPAYYELDTK